MSESWIICFSEVTNLLWILMMNYAMLRSHTCLEDMVSKLLTYLSVILMIIGVISVVLKIWIILRSEIKWMLTLAQALTMSLLVGSILEIVVVTHHRWEHVFGYKFNAELPWLSVFIATAELLAYSQYLKYKGNEFDMSVYLPCK